MYYPLQTNTATPTPPAGPNNQGETGRAARTLQAPVGQGDQGKGQGNKKSFSYPLTINPNPGGAGRRREPLRGERINGTPSGSGGFECLGHVIFPVFSQGTAEGTLTGAVGPVCRRSNRRRCGRLLP